MKLQQLRFLCQVVDSNFNVTAAAMTLNTSQSGVSHQVRLLEKELGAAIFLRQEKRLLGLTDVGRLLVDGARDVLASAAKMKAIVADFDTADAGQLTVATTHLHARYALLPVIARFQASYQATSLRLIQTFPDEILELLASDQTDLGLTTEGATQDGRFASVPTYPVERCVITPVDHPLLRRHKPSLADIARHPLITYDSRLVSGRVVSEAFDRAGVSVNTVLTAVDVDVIKAYVAAGLGVAVVPSLAYEEQTDHSIRSVSLDHLFQSATTYVVYRRDKYLRKHARAFIELLRLAGTRRDEAPLATARNTGPKPRLSRCPA